MSLKSISKLDVQYPNTYMEQFCKNLHPDLEFGAVCTAWFRQATKHCTNLLSNTKVPRSYIWNTFKNFIFPDRSTEIISQKVPISIHPNRLSLHDCHSLFLDIVRDYIERAPRYSAESNTNAMLWQVVYSVMGIAALGTLLIGTIYIYNKYGQTKITKNFLEDVFKPEKRMQAVAKRSLCLSKAELRNIRIRPLTKMGGIAPADGVEVLAIKVGTKHEFLESLVVGSLQSVGKFHKLREQYNKSKTDMKIEPLNKAMKFLDSNSKKLHLLLIFEDDVEYEEEQAARKCKGNSPKMNRISPRNTTLKGILNTRLEGGNVSHKPTDPSRPSSGKQPSTPRTTTTPRSTGSSIPLNLQKRSPIAKKSN